MTPFPLLPVTRQSEAGVDRWVVDTPAKVNLFLEVEGRRADGHHDITTLMAAIDFHDRLSFTVEPPGRQDELVVEGEPVPTGPDNLVRRALAALRELHDVPPLAITLEKRIPPGSGLGGGSGNAAGLLVGVDAALGLGLEPARLARLGGTLGADVPFFLGAPVAVGSGRGDELRLLDGRPFGGERPRLLLILPPVQVATASVYRGITFPLTSPSGPISFPERTFVNSGRWVRGLYNRLESVVIDASGALRVLADWLEERTPGRWRMTGSGSGFFVVLETPDSGKTLAGEIIEEFGAMDWREPVRQESREGALGNREPDRSTVRRDRPARIRATSSRQDAGRTPETRIKQDRASGLPGSRARSATLRIHEVEILTEPLPKRR